MVSVAVIGGGIAGLAAAYRLGQTSRPGPPLDVTLIESDARLGGKIVTERRDGFVLEGGPDSVIPQKPQALELIRELGLEERLLPSNDQRRGTSIYHRGRLVPVPDGLPMLVPSRWSELWRSPLLSWSGKLRLATEGLRPAQHSDADESVADFVRRRLGTEVLDQVAEPLLAHLHVGDVERMSLRSTYPRLADIEQRWGSLRKGVTHLRGRAPSPPDPLFWTLRGGLQEMVEALESRLEATSLLLGRRAVRLERSEAGGFRITLDDGHRLDAAAVVLATPAFVAADLVEDLISEVAERLRAIRYVSMATLSLGYRREDVRHPLERFGFFVPRSNLRNILACSWTSTKFDHRAPDGTVLLRSFFGGSLSEGLLDLDDDALTAVIEEELQEILGFRAMPTLRWLTRWPRGYPQFDVGHRERVEQIEADLPPGIVLAGSGYHGVGLPDCIRSGSEAAEHVRQHLGQNTDG